jgi:hypothetical protein
MLKRDKIVGYLRVNLVDVVLFFITVSLLAYMLYLKPGMDNIIDLMNYHAYNGWALTSGEWWNHFHPAFVHSYYINYQDVFHWLLIDNLNIEWVVLILSIIHLSSSVPVYFLAREIEPSIIKIRSAWIAVLSVNTIFFLPHVGDFNGDIISALPMLYAIWLLVKMTNTNNWKLGVIAGILTGLSLSMKLTNVIYAPFFLLFICYWVYKRYWKLVSSITVTTIISFSTFILPQTLIILSSTDWKNPLFPLYNNIFKSRLAPEEPLDLSLFKIPLEYIVDLYTRNLVQTSLLVDVRYVYLLIISLILITGILIKSLMKIIKKDLASGTKGDPTINIIVIMVISTFLSIGLWAVQFGFNRYYFGVWVMMIPLSFAILSYILKTCINQKIKTQYEALIYLLLVTILFANINPTISRPYEIPVGEKLFEPMEISEITKYNAIILPGPGQASWLTVLHREHIEKSGQVWLSSAFNREDAKRADSLIQSKDAKSVGYIAILGNALHTSQNLATLGYKDAGNCTPINIDKYGYWYSIYHVCDAVYTGVYKYEIDIEEKIYAGGSASTPIPTGDSPPEVFIPFKRNNDIIN